jgi:hypothetical protein
MHPGPLRWRKRERGWRGDGEGGEQQDSRMTMREAARAESSAPMLDVMIPAGAPISREGLMQLSEKKTPIPAPPRGLGRGLAEPSVRTMVKPEETRVETRLFAYERARAVSDGVREEAEPKTGDTVWH